MNKKRQTNGNGMLVGVVLAGLAMCGGMAQAATWTGGGADGSWTNVANWLGGALPAGDSVVYNASSTAQFEQTLDQGWNASGIAVTNPAGAITLSGAYTLTNGTGGIDMSRATRDLTINSGFYLANHQTLTVTNGRVLTLGGTIGSASTTNTLLVKGGGTLKWTGSAAASIGRFGVDGDSVAKAKVVIDGGTFRCAGSPTIFRYATMQITNSGVYSIDVKFNNDYWMDGVSWDISSGELRDSAACNGFFCFAYSQYALIPGPVVVSGTGGIKFVKFSSLLSRQRHNMALTIKDSGTVSVPALTLAGGCTNASVSVYGGTLTVGADISLAETKGSGFTALNASGSLAITNGTVIARGVVTSSASTSNAVGNVTLTGGRLMLGLVGISVGPSNSVMNVRLSGGTVGAISNWTSAVAMNLTNASGNVTFQCADTNGVARNIALSNTLSGVGGFVKTGGGTLTLAGTNTYAGVTAVSNGVLRLTHDQSLHASTDVAVATGASIDLAFTGTNTIRSLTVGEVLMKRDTVYSKTNLGTVLSGDGFLRTIEGEKVRGTLIRVF